MMRNECMFVSKVSTERELLNKDPYLLVSLHAPLRWQSKGNMKKMQYKMQARAELLTQGTVLTQDTYSERVTYFREQDETHCYFRCYRCDLLQ